MADGGNSSSPGRVPPHNLDAEAAVLCACLLDDSKRALDEARAVLGVSGFYADANQRIWDALLELDAEGKPVDVVTVAQRLRERNRLAQVGGPSYLAQISDATPAVAHVAEHARIVADKARQRRVIAVAQTIVAEGYEERSDVGKWSLDSAQALADVAGSGPVKDPAETFAELIPAALTEITHRSRHGTGIAGLDTGWTRYTELLGGLMRGKNHVVGGRPGMGKTGFTLGLALNVAAQGYGVIFCTAEMSKEELALRALAVEANVNGRHIQAGRMNQGEWAQVTAAAARLKKLPIAILPCSGWTTGQLRGGFRTETYKLAARGCTDVALGVFDYLQLYDGEREKGESREAEVSRIMRRLTWMCDEFNIAGVTVSQLNRALESRNNKNKRPTLADLRESGTIEQDAFTATLLYRDEYYNPASEWAGTVECIVAKIRNGAPGTVRLAYRAESTKFANLSEDEQERLPYYEENDA